MNPRPDQPVITKTCRLCGHQLHLVQDSSGSAWYHANAADEHRCWTANRVAHEVVGSNQ